MRTACTIRRGAIVGIYNLIWFTNTGYLDTTKTHRYCNGVIYEIEEQADGKFLCSGTCTTYEGQPVSRIFRVHPDGALDTSFDSEVVGGRAVFFSSTGRWTHRCWQVG